MPWGIADVFGIGDFESKNGSQVDDGQGPFCWKVEDGCERDGDDAVADQKPPFIVQLIEAEDDQDDGDGDQDCDSDQGGCHGWSPIVAVSYQTISGKSRGFLDNFIFVIEDVCDSQTFAAGVAWSDMFDLKRGSLWDAESQGGAMNDCGGLGMDDRRC